jgi:hypothetical protein
LSPFKKTSRNIALPKWIIFVIEVVKSLKGIVRVDVKGVKSEVFDFESHVCKDIRQRFLLSVFGFINHNVRFLVPLAFDKVERC